MRAGASGPGHFVPLSITADGLLLLLTVNNRLHTSRRAHTAAPWSTPALLPVEGIAIMGKALNDIFPHSGYTTVAPNEHRAWTSVDGELWEIQF